MAFPAVQERQEMNVVSAPFSRHVGFLNEYFRRSSGGFLPEIGRIKIGVRDPQTRVPRRLDHFLLTFPYRDENNQLVVDRELMRRVAEMTGQHPNRITRLPIKFVFDDPDLNLQVWFSCFRGGTQWCFGDGRQAQRLRDDKQGRNLVPCPCERVEAEYSGSDRCKPYARLSCVIEGATRIGGVWVFRTTSWRSIRNLIATLQLYHRITGGVLSGIRFWLTLTPVRVLVRGEPQRVYVVNVEYVPDDRRRDPVEELMEKGRRILEARIRHRVDIERLEREVRERLASLPYEEEAALGDEIQEEFYPENGTSGKENRTEAIQTAAGESVSDAPEGTAEENGTGDKKPLTEPQRKMLTALLAKAGLSADLDALDFDAGARLISALQRGDMEEARRIIGETGAPVPESSPGGEESSAEEGAETGATDAGSSGTDNRETTADAEHTAPEKETAQTEPRSERPVSKQQIAGLKNLAKRMGFDPSLVDRIAPRLTYDDAADIFRTAGKDGSDRLRELLEAAAGESGNGDGSGSAGNAGSAAAPDETRTNRSEGAQPPAWMKEAQEKALRSAPEPPPDEQLPF